MFPTGKSSGGLRVPGTIVAFLLIAAAVIIFATSSGARRRVNCDLCGKTTERWVQAQFSAKASNIFARVNGLGVTPIEGKDVEWVFCEDCFIEVMQDVRSHRR